MKDRRIEREKGQHMREEKKRKRKKRRREEEVKGNKS
jgi:hypothetical protein